MVPAVTAVTRPEASTVATPGEALDHMPPGVISASCVVDPWHIAVVPVIGATTGGSLTVTFLVAALVQLPEVTVYVINEAPGAIPVTKPVASTPAINGSELVHTPPDVISESWVVAPVHTEDVPVIGDITTGEFTFI